METTAPPDLHWFRRHLVEELRPLWLEHATTPRGIFLPQLDRRRQSWWPQCEAMRALLLHHLLRGRPDLLGPLARLIRFARERFLDPEHGGWYPALHRDGTPARTDKGSEWKVDYHVVGMCVEATRLAQVARGLPI